MKRKIMLLSVCLMLTGFLFAQTERFDIASFTPPQGWQRIDTNGTVAFFDSKTTNGLTSFCQIILYPSSNSTGNASKNFKTAWQNLVTIPTKSNVKPVTQTEKTPDGWTVVTGSANIINQGISYKSIVANITGFGKMISVQVNTAGGDYAATLEKFFNDMDLDSKTNVTANTQSNNSNQTNMNGAISLNDYDFIVPEKWQVQKNKDHLLLQNMQSGCLIRILEPQSSSGNLEADVKSVFDLMYQGWQYQKRGEQQYILSKGFLLKGLEYYMMEAPMSMTSADGRYNLEEGAALVVKAGNQIVIISIRHNSSALGHNDCQHNYNTWGRFFNSFTVKNSTVPENKEEVSSKIIGTWSQTESGASSEYVFAANGNYALIGAIGSKYTSSDYRYDYLHIKTYAFQGDGSYSISRSQLTLKNRENNTSEDIPFRFETVNHGGIGWNDRICLLKRDATIGKEYEVGYEKRKQ